MPLVRAEVRVRRAYPPTAIRCVAGAGVSPGRPVARQRLSRRAGGTIPFDGRHAHTVAHTGELAAILDRRQYDHGHGPSLTAAAANITVSIQDMAGDSRWPQWAEHAITAGVHSWLSIGLPLHELVTGALTLYATESTAFDEDAIVLAQTFAGYAAVAMANAHLYGSATLAEQLRATMAGRAVIDQAKGIIMGDRRCDADEASEILLKTSQYSHRSVTQIAAALVASATTGRVAGATTGRGRSPADAGAAQPGHSPHTAWTKPFPGIGAQSSSRRTTES
jgi:hypothetical protein